MEASGGHGQIYSTKTTRLSVVLAGHEHAQFKPHTNTNRLELVNNYAPPSNSTPCYQSLPNLRLLTASLRALDAYATRIYADCSGKQ